MNRESTPIPEPVAQLQRQLEQFRSTQPGRTKLPESLWQAAVELARQHGVYPVAHPLRLDYMGLKKRLGQVAHSKKKASRPAFVELIATRPATVPECVIEFDCSAMTARDTGWRKSGSPRGGSRGGRKRTQQPSSWRLTKPSC